MLAALNFTLFYLKISTTSFVSRNLTSPLFPDPVFLVSELYEGIDPSPDVVLSLTGPVLAKVF